jgi:hypothetical protein
LFCDICRQMPGRPSTPTRTLPGATTCSIPLQRAGTTPPAGVRPTLRTCYRFCCGSSNACDERQWAIMHNLSPIAFQTVLYLPVSFSLNLEMRQAGSQHCCQRIIDNFYGNINFLFAYRQRRGHAETVEQATDGTHDSHR